VLTAKVHVTLKPGVLDPQGKAIAGSLGHLGFAQVGEVRQGKYFELTLTEADPERAHAVLSNLINVQAFYGQDLVEIRLVAYGPGLRHLLRDEYRIRQVTKVSASVNLTFWAGIQTHSGRCFSRLKAVARIST